MINTTKVWFTSDLHLGHRTLIMPKPDGTTYRRPGYEERYLKAWGNTVKKDDIIFVLGDVAFGKQAYWFERLSNLPGRKILIKGNHDGNRDNWYRKWGFERVVPFGEYAILKLELGKGEGSDTYYGQIMLSHVPAFTSVGATYDDRFQGLMGKYERWFNRCSCILNLHGHTHGKGAEKHNTYDVGLEVVGEKPIRMDQILQLKFPGISVGEVVS